MQLPLLICDIGVVLFWHTAVFPQKKAQKEAKTGRFGTNQDLARSLLQQWCRK
jgi:hypothetical protein